MADTWQTIVLKVLSDRESKYKAGTRYQIRIVQKAKNGQHAAIKVQVGEEYVKAATGEVAFKTTDMSLMDIKKINEYLAEIEAFVKNPPAIPVEEKTGANDVGF